MLEAEKKALTATHEEHSRGFAEEKKGIVEGHEAFVRGLQSDVKAAAAERSESLAADKARLMTQREELGRGYEAEKRGIVEGHEARMRELSRGHNAEIKGIVDGHEARVRELQAQLQTAVQKGDALASEKAQLAARAQAAAAAAAQLEEKVG